jgi:hypothetical protein
MKTKSQFIAELQVEYPVIQIGSDQVGYTDLTPAEYEGQIAEWADTLLAKQEAEALAEAEKAKAEEKRDAALAKLAALGLTPDDLKALGL